MKISKYTFCLDLDNGEYYLYNTLSNVLLEIDKQSFDYLHKTKESDEELMPSMIDSELWEILQDKKIVTEDDRDEFLIYKSLIMPMREQHSFMHLTLAPTMDCNFRCFYCFEKEKPKGAMSEEIMDSIVKYVTASTELRKIYLTWFGGEPLMALPQMEQFYNKLRAVYDKEFDSNIITTGYYLDESVIPVLEKLNITSVQITLDGNKETHNKVKFMPDCDDVFSKVLSNIDLLTEKAPQINVAFRINITKLNAAQYLSLYHYLIERYQGKNVSIAPGFVKDRLSTKDHKSNVDACCLSRDESAEFVLELWNKHRVHTPSIRYSKDLCSECAIRDQQAISFDAQGYAYKCWEMIGQHKFAIGQIDDKGEITKVNRLLINRQLYGADPMVDEKCSQCSYLPICDGGCPIQRIQNEFENGNNDVCTFHKNRLTEFMKIHIELKKAGFENK